MIYLIQKKVKEKRVRKLGFFIGQNNEKLECDLFILNFSFFIKNIDV